MRVSMDFVTLTFFFAATLKQWMTFLPDRLMRRLHRRIVAKETLECVKTLRIVHLLCTHQEQRYWVSCRLDLMPENAYHHHHHQKKESQIDYHHKALGARSNRRRAHQFNKRLQTSALDKVDPNVLLLLMPLRRL